MLTYKALAEVCNRFLPHAADNEIIHPDMKLLF
jgi:hypothetical protein